MKRTILLALLVACGTAQATDWASLGKSDDGAQEVFVDVSRIRVKTVVRRAWIETLFAPHRDVYVWDGTTIWIKEVRR